MATEVDAAAVESTPPVVENTTANPASEAHEEQESAEKKESSHKPADDDRRGSKTDGKRFNGHYNKKYGKPRTNNILSRYDQEAQSNDPDQIRKQVEFYFSDANLKQDKFLFEKVQGSKNEPVALSIIHAFKRMKRFQPYTAVVAALKDSDVLNVIDGDQPGSEMLQRKKALDENVGHRFDNVRANYENEAMQRTIYAKGFGEETENSQLEIEKLFDPYMPSQVRLRRDVDKKFKGSVWVEFASESEAKQFLEQENKPEWNGKQLDIKSKTDYCQMKDKMINEGKLRRNDIDDDRRGRSNGRGRGRGQGRGRGYGRGRGRGNHHRNHSRTRNEGSGSESRSRSRERGGEFADKLKQESWRKLADEEEGKHAAKNKDNEESAPPTNDKKRARDDEDGANGAEDTGNEPKKAKAAAEDDE